MKTIYKNKESKQETLALYDKQLMKLSCPYTDIYVDTSYGKWASEVIDGLGFTSILCFGGSFGGGVLAKLMCVAPDKIKCAVLEVPSAIHHAIPIGSCMLRPKSRCQRMSPLNL